MSKTARRQTGAMRDALRARIILLAADGLKNQEIAKTLGTSGNSVGKWRRRGAFKSVLELTEAIHSYIEAHNRNPKPYVWTKTAEEIINKLKPVYQMTNNTNVLNRQYTSAGSDATKSQSGRLGETSESSGKNSSEYCSKITEPVIPALTLTRVEQF